MRGNDTLAAMLAILKELDGYFVFTDDVTGEEFVIAPKSRVQLTSNEKTAETQLQLEPKAVPADQGVRETILEDMNRAIALTREAEQEAAFDDLGVAASEYDFEAEPASDLPPPRRVRFEPLRGDLPPELQE